MSDYPIGATWKAVDGSGTKSTVWKDEVYPTFEVWKVNWCYSDGSGGSFEWFTNRRQAIEWGSCKLNGRVRFKRV